jgi:CHAT domain-containing protein
MPDTPLDLFVALGQISSLEEVKTYIWQHPVLLSPAAQDQLAKQFAALSEEQAPQSVREELADGLQRLVNLRTTLENQPSDYPFGPGPLEQLWQREQNKEISHEHALELARKDELVALLSPVYVRAISANAMVIAQQYDAASAGRLQELLVAAVSRLPLSDEALEMLEQAALDWLSIAKRILQVMPDGRIYRSAQTFAEQVIAKLEKEKRRESLGLMLTRLGALNLDPYVADRFTPISESQVEDWMAQLRVQLGEAEFLKHQIDKTDDQLRMPAPGDALRLAESSYRQAIEMLDGHAKGLSLKALIMTLEWRRSLGAQVDTGEISRLAGEATKLIDPALAPNEVLFVVANQVGHNQPFDRGVVDRLLATSLDHYVRKFGIVTTIDLVQQASTILADSDPVRSLEVMRDARELFEQYDSQRSRIDRWNHMLAMIKRAFAPELPAAIPPGGLRAAAEEMRDRSHAEGWDIRKYSAGLIILATDSSHWDEKSSALELLTGARQFAPYFTKDYDDALNFLAGHILSAMCSAYGKAGALTQAVKSNSEALRLWLTLRLPALIEERLKVFELLSRHTGDDVSTIGALSDAIASHALRLENLGASATDQIQQTCRNLVSGIANHLLRDVDLSELFFTLIQLAKGLRFSTALLTGSQYDRLKDERGKALLEQINQAEIELSKEQSGAFGSAPALSDEEIALSAYIQPEEFQFSGESASERVANLQHSFDANLNLRLLAGVGDKEALTFSVEQIRGALDDRTALLNYYIGLSEDRELAVWLFLLTHEGASLTWVKSPGFSGGGSILTAGDEQRLRLNPAAVRIQELRRMLLETPEADFVARGAGELLAEDVQNFLGPLQEPLAQLRAAGKDHLCIVPHGPLHYYPFHLLGEAGKPLADEWTVTYLPNLSLLVSPGGKPKVRSHRPRALTAIGLAFEHENPFALEPIPESISECRKVAGIFDIEPVTDTQATESALLEALRSSRYVHVSTHGRHNVVAPSFQCLYLTPDAESDGRLYAHEIVSMEFNGLEVLTLSACETALGRFDVADNLRGLPASFLLAGVETIVGTLWPAAVDPTEQFFTVFYRELKMDKSRLDAFAVAQKETRNLFPEYRDWGPFYLIGRWD